MMNKREKIYAKYNGKCAYTGKPLGDDWQIDHMFSVSDIYYQAHGHLIRSGLDPKMYEKELMAAVKEKANRDENLIPALRIVNQYKRSLDLEGFRERMKTFHIRLWKLPKNTKVSATVKRIAYMNEVAEAFGITPDKPFDGKFYFEKLEEEL